MEFVRNLVVGLILLAAVVAIGAYFYTQSVNDGKSVIDSGSNKVKTINSTYGQ